MRLRKFFFALLCTWATLSGAQDTLLLFHPTIYNLELMEHLAQEGVLNLENYHVLGVYHSGEVNPYEQALLKVSENWTHCTLELNQERNSRCLFLIILSDPSGDAKKIYPAQQVGLNIAKYNKWNS